MLTVISVAAVVLVAGIIWYSPLPVAERLGLRNYFGAALLAAWIAGIGASALGGTLGSGAVRDSDLMSAVRDLGPVDWNDSLDAPAVRNAVQAQAGATDDAMNAAPIPSLIGGLEARLAAAPADAKGWALLAQSYAFVGRRDDAQAAVARAVELGFDESSLRVRVEASMREAHGGDWIQQAVSR